MSEIKLFSGQIDLIGYSTKAGVILTDYIVDGRILSGDEDKFDVIVYRGMFENRPVAVKIDYNQFREGTSTAPKVFKMFEENCIETFNYFFDYFDILPEGIDVIDMTLLVMDELQPITKSQVFPMLKSVIDFCFQYKPFMTHGDIKPDNIMYSIEKDQFYLIDYDSVCIQPLMYGFIRIAQTPLFATQNIVANPTIITLKNDLLELILSANAIANSDDAKKPQSMVWNQDRFHRKRLFSVIYLCALNIDERNITKDDYHLLTKIIHLTEQVKEHPTEAETKLSKIQHMIVSNYLTNNQILKMIDD